MNGMILLAACMISSTIKGDYGWAMTFQAGMILIFILETLTKLYEAKIQKD